MSCDAVHAVQPARRAPDPGYVPARPENILKRIKGLGHRTVTMWPYPGPCDHPPGAELAETVSDCSVAYRGCTYPHLGGGPYGVARTTDGYAEACHDAFGHMSIWRFYRSGEFKEYAALREDILDAGGHAGAPSSSLPPGGRRPRYLEPIWLLYAVSEVFAFASGLAASTGKKYAVSVALAGMGGRVLDIRTPGRIGFSDERMSREDRIELDSAAVDPIFGVALHGRIALEKTLEVLDRFGWSGDRQREILEYDQEMFFAKARWE